MGLTELVTSIGDENIEVQNLESSSIKMKVSKKHGDLEITFASPHDIMNGCGKVGFVIWMDEEKVKEVLG